MPASGLNRRFTEMHRSSERGIALAHVCALADLYQVSVQALVLRLEELRRLPNGTWARLEEEGFKVRSAQQVLGIDAKEARSRFNAEEDDTYKNLELNLASPLGGR